MTHKIAVKTVLAEAAKYKGTALPENPQSEALSMAQARALTMRFAAEDVNVYMLLTGIRAGRSGSKPLTPGRIWSCFNVYAQSQKTKNNRAIELAPDMWLTMGKNDLSGLMKTETLAQLIQLAFKARHLLAVTQQKIDQSFVDVLAQISQDIEEIGRDELKLSAAEITLIKNIVLPTNAVERRLDDRALLIDGYCQQRDAMIRRETGEDFARPLMITRDDRKIQYRVEPLHSKVTKGTGPR